MSDECRIRCMAKPGAFEGEMVVRLATVDSQGRDAEATCLAYLDSLTLLQGKADESGEVPVALRAHYLEKRDDVAAVVLPQSTFANGTSVLVRTSNLI